MAWLTALIKAILEWLTAEVKKDTKAGDADSVPQPLKDRWRDRINKQLEKAKKQKELNSLVDSGKGAVGHQGHEGHQGWQGRQDENN